MRRILADSRFRWLVMFLLGVMPMVMASRTSLAQKPNIIYILADDMGLGDVRCYTHVKIAPVNSPVATPNIDSLASHGMRFTNAHSPSAVCTPTRYGILTGRYAWRSRLKKGVVRAYERALIETGRPTVANVLQDKGYQTAAIGKWHLGANWQDADGKHTENAKRVDFSKPIFQGPTARGFDVYFGDDIINWGPFRWIENDRTLDLTTHPHVENEVLSTITAKSVEYINAQAQTKEPFFLYMPLTAPHAPIAPVDGNPELQSVYNYDSLSDYEKFIANVDWSVGRVLKALDDQGIRDNTMIVFASDNGVSKNFSTQDDVSPGFVAGELLRGQKADIWEGGHRMPFIVEWSGQIEAGSVSNEYVELNDFYATVAEIVGAEINQQAAEDSYSLLSVLKGETLADPLREAGVNHSITGKFAIRHIDEHGNEWKLIYGFGSGGFTKGKGPVIDPQAPITDLADFRLFNLTDDPNENDPFCLEKGNVTDEIRAKIFELDKILKRYISTGRSVPVRIGERSKISKDLLGANVESANPVSHSVSNGQKIELIEMGRSKKWQN